MSFLTNGFNIVFFNRYFIILVQRFVFCFLISLSTPISGECTNNKKKLKFEMSVIVSFPSFLMLRMFL